MVLVKTLKSLLDCKESKPVNPKGNHSWIFIRKTDAEAEAPILWPPDGKNRIIGKDPDPGKDWRQEEKGVTGDEMVEGYHWFNGPEFELTLPVRRPKYWSFSFSISPVNEYSGLISFRIDWFDFLAVQGTLKSLFSITTVQKYKFLGAQLSLWSNSHIHTWLLENP